MAIYVTLGGLVSAVLNEVLQFFLIWFGSLLIPILGLIQAGGWSGMMEKIRHNVPIIFADDPVTKHADFTHLWRSLGSFDTNPMGIDWFGMVFGLGLAVSFGYWCTDFLQVQRVIVAKNLRAAQNGTIIGAVLKICVPLIVTIPGLLGLAVLLNSNGSPIVLVPENDVRANITNHTFNDVLPLLMGKYLGPGLLGLGVTAMIAGFMSGMAGNVSAFATVWTYDVYRPLLNRNASDRHYLLMGRWSSLLGVLISIATAYALFYFSNILEFLQVLIFFFIVPLFGIVILGMLWKRATPTGGFVGFLLAIVVSMGMWVYVHTFPEGYRPAPKVVLGKEAVVTLDSSGDSKSGRTITRVVVESGALETTNVPIATSGAKEPVWSGDITIRDEEVTLPARAAKGQRPEESVRVLAPEVTLAGDHETTRFGADGVPVVLKAGVKIRAADVQQTFVPAVINPAHAQWVARSRDAKPMAVNMYSGFWTLVVSVVTTIAVSLVTVPRTDAEMKNLVMGLTPLPNEGPCPWYEKPLLWATIVFAVLIAINVIFF